MKSIFKIFMLLLSLVATLDLLAQKEQVNSNAATSTSSTVSTTNESITRKRAKHMRTWEKILAIEPMDIDFLAEVKAVKDGTAFIELNGNELSYTLTELELKAEDLMPLIGYKEAFASKPAGTNQLVPSRKRAKHMRTWERIYMIINATRNEIVAEQAQPEK